MSVLTTNEQALYDWARTSVPASFFKGDVAHEIWGAMAKALEICRAQGASWLEATYILSATDVWLDAHAADRGTRRRLGETDEVLRGRIRSYEDALTRSAIIDGTQALLDLAGVTDPFYVLELRRDRAYLNGNATLSGTGGTFVGPTGGVMVFTPTVAFTRPPFSSLPNQAYHKLVLTGAANAGNNGTFTTTGVSENGAEYTNASGVAVADATVTWAVERFDRSDDQQITSSTGGGRRDAYLSRGFRMGNDGFIIILPSGTTATVQASVLELLRQKKAAGIAAVVERRA